MVDGDKTMEQMYMEAEKYFKNRDEQIAYILKEKAMTADADHRYFEKNRLEKKNF